MVWKKPKWVYRFYICVHDYECGEVSYQHEDILYDSFDGLEEMYIMYDWLYDDDASWELLSWSLEPIWSWRDFRRTLRFEGIKRFVK